MEQHTKHTIHRWIRKTLHSKALWQVFYINCILLSWSTRRSLDVEQIKALDSWASNIPDFIEGFNMHFINPMPSEFENMSYYIKMWCAVMLNEVFHEMAELARDPTTCNA